MKKLYSLFFLRTAFAVLLMLTFVRGWGQINEGFESTTTPATNWIYNSVTHETSNFRSGARCAGFNADNDAIISPLIANPNQLSFWWRRSGTSPTSPQFTVQYSSSTGGPWTNITGGTTNPITSFTTTYQEFTANLSSLTNIYIRVLHNRTAGGNVVYIDDFSVTALVGKTVTFNSNYGTPTTTTQTSSTTANLTANSFTRTGYSFANWHTTMSGTGGTTYTNGQSYDFLADLTLYSQWNINQYNVSYDLNGGSGTTPTAQSGNYNTNLTLATGAGFTRAGFTFSGWNTAANGSGTAFASGGTYTIPALSQTLYAQWTAVPALTPPTLTAAIGATVDNPFAVTFTEDAAWRAAITGITVAGTPLTAGYALSAGNITFTPSASAPASLLQQGGTKTIVIKATGYSDASVSQPINAGAPVKIVISTQPAGPTTNGGLLVTQPILDLSDQYNNATSATSATATATVGTGAWTLGGTTVVSSVGSAMTYSNLTATSPAEVIGATMVFSAQGFPSVTSGPFNIPGPILPVITSSLTKSNIYGTADTYTITASGSPTAYSTGTLPPGFSFSGNVITKSVSVDQGTYNISITATNGGGSDTKTLVWTVTPKPLSITGIAGANKVYDGSVNATVTGNATLSGGIIGSDDVRLSGAPAFFFANANVNTTKPITVTGYTLSGTRAGNYSLVQPTTLTADITAKPLSISTPTIASRVYSPGVLSTGVITAGTLSGFVGTETVTATASGTYADENAGTGKPATIVYSLANGSNGGLATNYSIAKGTGTGDVTKAISNLTPLSITVNVGGTYNLPNTAFTTSSDGAITYSITSTGHATLSGSTITGVAVGSEDLTVNQTEGTNYLARTVLVTITVTNISYPNNSYLSTTGSGSYTSASSWGRCGNVGGCTGTTFGFGGWSALGAGTPVAGSTIFVQGNITGATNGVANATILANGILTTATNYPISQSILIKSNGTFRTNYGAVVTIASSATLTVEDNGNLYINTAFTNPTTSIWNGIENFYPNSNLYINNWRADGTNRFLVNNDVTSNTHNGKSAVFGNVYIDAIIPIINSANNAEITNINNNGFGGGNWTIVGPSNASPLNLTHGDFVFVNAPQNVANQCSCGTASAAGIKIPRFLSSGTPANFQINILGDLKTTSTWLYSAFFSSVGNVSLNINKNLTLNSGTFAIRGSSGANDVTANVEGNITLLANSVLNFNTQNYTADNGNSILNLKGDLSTATGSSISNGGPVEDTEFNFAGTGDGLLDSTTQTIDVKNAATLAKINFNITSGAYTKLINQNLSLGTNSKFNVLSGGTLDFGFDGAVPLNIVRSASTSGQSFEAAENSILKITSPEGIVAGNTTPALELYKGNVQIGATAANRVFAVGATYHYIGKTNQATGSGLPSGITGKVIVDLQTTDALNENLDFTSTGTTTFGTLSGTNGTLDIRKGKVLDIPNNGFRNFNGTTNVNDDGEMDIQKGNIIMSGGRYVISGAGTKPNLTGTYTLTGGTVEFTGSAATKIRTSSPAKQYYNVDVSGTNVETGGKNFVVNQILKAINPVIVTESSLLTIPEVADNETPFVVNAKKGVQVASRGKILFKNNANLLQDIGAANEGNITMERKATVPNKQYNYWASPVKNQALFSLYGGLDMPNNTVKIYNTATDFFTNLPKASNPTSIFGKGYSIKGPSTASDLSPAMTATFVGVPNNETTTLADNTIPLSIAGNRFNLIGNPYPSNLNLVELYNANLSQFHIDGVDTPTAFLWDNTGNTDLTQLGSTYTGYAINNYATVNLSSGLGTPATRHGVVGKKPNGIVRPGQGFIIKAATGATELTFKNEDMRTSSIVMGGTNSEYFKNSSSTSNDNFWLTLTTPSNMNVVIAMSYNPNAENTFERFDSTVPNEAVTENLFSLSSDAKKLAIQSRKDFTTSDVVPLGIKSSKTGIQKISIDEKYGIFENQKIYLKDKLLNIVADLSAGPYEFTTPIGITENRFEIVYEPNITLGTGNTVKESLQVYRKGEDFIIKSGQNKIDKVEVYDAAGRLLKSVKGKSNEIIVEGSSLSSGMYILNINRNNETINKKIIK